MENSELPKDILNFLTGILGDDALTDLKVKECKSAQQQVWILEGIHRRRNSLPEEWMEALKMGNNHLVVRQWKASSCWWNLNSNQPGQKEGQNVANEVDTLAASEVSGYRIARKALPLIHIPSVLHYSLDSDLAQRDDRPWAILAYVGPDSAVFDQNCHEDHSWMDSMVKTRFEFGFEEPHPR